MMDEEQIKEFIQELKRDIEEQNLCVFKNQQTYDCVDCTICREDFYNRVHEDFIQGCQPFSGTHWDDKRFNFTEK